MDYTGLKLSTVESRVREHVPGASVTLDGPNGVVITGQTKSFYRKQMAQEMVRQELPTHVIENRVEVS